MKANHHSAWFDTRIFWHIKLIIILLYWRWQSCVSTTHPARTFAISTSLEGGMPNGQWQFVWGDFTSKEIQSLAHLNEDLILENGWIYKILCTEDSGRTQTLCKEQVIRILFWLAGRFGEKQPKNCYWVVAGSMDCTHLLSFDCWCYRLLTVRPSVRYMTSRCLHFLSCKIKNYLRKHFLIFKLPNISKALGKVYGIWQALKM